MKTLLPLLLISATLLALPAPAGAQLEPDSVPVSLGPLGGSASSVVVRPGDPDEILIIRYTEGVFRSTDGGATFGLSPYGSGITGEARELIQDPQDADTLWALQGPRVLKSTDFGASWTTLPLVADYADLKDLAVAPTGDDLLALDAFNVYHSPDGGTTWNDVLEVVPFSGAVVDQVVYAPGDATRAYVGVSGAGQGIHRSDDGGASWTNAQSFPSTPKRLIATAADADVLFVGTSFDGLFVSTDGSATWNPVFDLDTSGNANWFFEEADGTLWFSTYEKLVYSLDGGTNWIPGHQGWPENTPIPLALAVDANGKRYLGCEGGGLQDQSGGGLYAMPAGTPSTWTHIGFLVSLIRDVAIAEPGGQRVIGIGGGVYAGDPGAVLTPTAWHADIGADTYALAVDPSDPDRWLAAGVGYGGNTAQVVVITDGGSLFEIPFQEFGMGTPTDVEFSHHDPNRVVVGIWNPDFGREAIVYSGNGGDTWDLVPGTEDWATRAVSFDPHNAGAVVMIQEDNQWAASGDFGQSWSPLLPAWSGTGEAVLFEYDLHVPGQAFRGETGDGLWRSSDALATWTPLGVSLHEHSALLQHPQFPNLLWVTDADGHVLVSTDGGDSFQVALDLPLGTDGASMALDTADGSLLIGTTSASTWELPNAAPALQIGEGTAGTGGFVPRVFLSSGLAQVGSTDFSIAGDGFRGGTTVFLAYGLSATDVPAFGGHFYVGNLLNVFAFPVGGTPGVGGTGSFDFPFPLPADPLLVGFPVFIQCGAIDPAVVNSDHIALSNGLKITFHN